MAGEWIYCNYRNPSFPANTFKQWNTMFAGATTLLALVDESNVATAYTWQHSTAPKATSNGMNAVGTGDAAWVDEAVISVNGGWVDASVPQAIMDISGFAAGATVEFEFFSSRTGSGTRRAEVGNDSSYTNGVEIHNAYSNSSLTTTASFTADGSGVVPLRWRRFSTDTIAYMMAFRFREVVATVDTLFDVFSGQLPTDTSDLDITTTAAPLVALVGTTYAQAINTDTAHAGISVGITDFDRTLTYSYTGEDAIGTSDTAREGDQTGEILRINEPGTGTTWRTATAEAVATALRITPIQAGDAGRSDDQYQIAGFTSQDLRARTVVGGFNTSAGSTFKIPHGQGRNFGGAMIFYGAVGSSASGNANMSYGFVSATANDTYKQCCYGFEDDASAGTGDLDAMVRDNRVAILTNAGAIRDEVELTAIDDVYLTFSVTTSTTDGDLHILTMSRENNEIWCGLIDSPDATGATDITEDEAADSIGFDAANVFIVPNNLVTKNVYVNSGAVAGAHGFYFTDLSNEYTLGYRNEFGVTTMVSKSRLSNEFRHTDDTGTETYAGTVSSATGGFTMTLDTANATTHLWPCLVIGETTASGGGGGGSTTGIPATSQLNGVIQ